MDMKLFADSLTIQEVNYLMNILWERKRDYVRMNHEPLSIEERELARSGEYIQAIKAYRQRLGVGLFESKMAVDVFTGRR